MIDMSQFRSELRQLADDTQRRAPWVHAVGIGQKLVAGRPIDQNTITFFVTRKLPDEMLDADVVIPKWIELRGLGTNRTLPTDVVAMPPLTFASCTVNRPANGGNCIAPLASPMAGTLGAVLKRKSDGKLFILSASHTLLRIGGTLPIGQIICHPIGTSLPIAKVTHSTPWSTSAVMIGDAGLAEVTAGAGSVEQTVNGIGTLTGMASPAAGVSVRFSAQNGMQSGIVLWTNVTVIVDQTYRFENTFFTNALAKKGDSGAVVVNNANAAMGIVFADNGFVTACTDLNAVSDTLGLGEYQF